MVIQPGGQEIAVRRGFAFGDDGVFLAVGLPGLEPAGDGAEIVRAITPMELSGRGA